MRHNPRHAVTEEAVVRRLLAEHPFVTLVSVVDGSPVASHYPALLEDGPGLSLVTHVGRPDEDLHRLGSGEVLVVVAGPHGYVSPSWYAPGSTLAPTWNFTVAHLYGTPQVLGGEENIAVLTRLVDRFEAPVAHPVRLTAEFAARVAPGTVGVRLPVDRYVCKVKMSQDKDPVSRANVLAELGGDGPYAHPALAADMARALDEGLGMP